MGDVPPDLPCVLCGRYAIEHLLGRGGMASVYLARDRKHDRLVAVKVLSADTSRAVGAERFLREIAVVAQLTHPNILPLHDSGEAEGTLFYVMPFVEGETLRGRLQRERQLPLDDALRIACEVTSALDFAHRQKILHRDIKPENILLEDGHAIVADFGIACAVGGAADSRLTATGISLGTPAYMSPEQSSGDPFIDGRSDVYSLACVLYEMLAGEPPFSGPTAQSIINKRLSSSPPRIRVVRPSVPVSVEKLLLRALDPVPADRTPTARSFREALESCTTDDASLPSAAPRRRIRIGSRAMALLLLVGLGWAVRDRFASAQATTTLAILPLANASTDPEFAFLAEGLTDALIGDLGSVEGMRVVSRMSIMRYGGMSGEMGEMSGGMAFMGGASNPEPAAAGGVVAAGMGAPKPLAVIAHDLSADVLLQGRLVRHGDSVSVTAFLKRSPSLALIWQSTFTRHVRELFRLQKDLASAIVAAIMRDRGSTATWSDSVPAYDPAAHEAYLKASAFQAHWKLPEAVKAFEQAVQLDPAHAQAQAGLARAYYFLAFFGDVPPGIALSAMRRSATAALEKDSMLAEGYAQLALVKMLQDWDWDSAERLFKRALEISPGHAQIRHDYAHFLLGQGRPRESWEQTRQAMALDPVNPMLISCLGWHSLFDARFDEAIGFARTASTMMPDHWAQVVLGWALLGEGKGDSAVAAFREARRLNRGAFTLAALGHGLAMTGHTVEARQMLDSLLAQVEREYVSPYDIATVYAGLGEADGAFTWLRRAAEERSMFIVQMGWDSRFGRIRRDPRFAELATRELRLPMSRFAASAGERRRM